MAISSNLLNQLKKHKFKNGDTITYTELNNPNNAKTPTDIANEIYNSFNSSNTKDQKIILEAIFDGVYDIVENSTKNSKNKFGLLDPKTKVFSELEISNNNKGGIEFKTSNKIKISITINTPEVINKTTDDQTLKQENETLKSLGVQITDKNLKAEDFAKLAEVFNNMAKSK